MKTSKRAGGNRSPAVPAASNVKRKYSRGYAKSPSRATSTRRALFEVNQGQTIKAAAQKFGLNYSFLYRRAKGYVSIGRRNGPPPVLSEEEEALIAKFISDMALRGMGLAPSELMDLVQQFLKKENRKNPFTGGRPSYTWYYSFIARHGLVMRKETPLESCRAKVTPQVLDEWFDNFEKFLSDRDLLDKPHRIFNADETGFTMGSKSGKVIGPARQMHKTIPHLSGGSIKSRYTVMYCANAEGYIIPPFIVYPNKMPKAYNPLCGAQRGTDAAYTEKGWMDAQSFSKFLDHFDLYAGLERPVILIIDSVSSHIDMESFQKASDKQIEIYRLVPNSTHLMQPLDKGVFGPLKKQWYKTVNKNTRENPDKPIGKREFAGKLAEAQLEFYKPSIVVNSFKATGIFPVNRNAISEGVLQPSITFSLSSPTEETEIYPKDGLNRSFSPGAEEAFSVFNSVLSTPQRQRYQQRFDEGYDLEGQSPGYTVYRRLKDRCLTEHRSPSVAPETPRVTPDPIRSETPKVTSDLDMSGLEILASAATCTTVDKFQSMEVQPNASCSSVLQELLQLPSIETVRQKPQRLLDSLPDCLTSETGIRAMALSKLKTARDKAVKEKLAKSKYLAKMERESQKSVKRKVHGTAAAPKRKKQPNRSRTVNENESLGTVHVCPVCEGCYEHEVIEDVDLLWVQCDECFTWMHHTCIPVNFDFDREAFSPDSTISFTCHLCTN